MFPLLIVSATAALLAVPLVGRFGARGSWAVAATALAPAAVAVWALTVLVGDGAGAVRSATLPWIPDLGLSLSLRLDPLSAVMVLVVTVVGAGVLVYSSGYFAPEHAPPGVGPAAAADALAVADRTRVRTVALLVAFAAAMLVLVLADDLLVLYVGWELTTVLSWLLVGGEGRRAEERRRAVQALVVTTAGGLAMLVGFVVLWHLGGTTRISALLADPPPASPLLTVAALCVLAGAATKCALVPFTAWLPGAMVAPTPVSAYLHAAAMVKAGVYLVARFSPLFADVPAWRVAAVTLGCATMLVGGWRSLRQVDLKLVLAWGTVSQLGFMVALFGAGGRTATLAGTGMLIAHALFKSTLFLVAGAVDHGAGTRDLRRLDGLARRAPLLLAASVAAAASMAGLPPLLGFVTKESAFEAFTTGLAEGEPAGADLLVAVVLVVGSMLTVAYSVRFVRGAFGPASPHAAGVASEDGDVGEHGWHAPSLALVAPPVLGGTACLVLGLWPAPVGAMVDAVAATSAAAPRAALSAAVAAPEDYHLALWHGLGLPLAASALAVLGGVVLAVAAEPVARAATALAARRALAAVAPGALYDRGLAALFGAAALTTRTAQRGSLPQYLLVIFAVLLAGPGAALVVALVRGWPRAWRLADDPLQVVVGALVVVAALAAVGAHHRRTAVLLVGGSGYLLAALFALAGAPDLALTQLLVESLTLVAFVLVLRSLPARFSASTGPGGSAGEPEGSEHRARRTRRALGLRAIVAVGTGALFALLSSAALAARSATSVSERFPALAALGGGKNVVNVTLVDIRAWDTLGEISVLVAAATGVASLVFLTSRTGSAPRLSDDGGLGEGGPADAGGSGVPVDGPRSASGAPAGRGWLPTATSLAPEQRSVVVELVVRLAFPTVLVLSVWVLFSGHSAPGGGFAGGLVAGLALALRYVAGGRHELGEAMPVSPGLLLGGGLGLAAAAIAAPLAVGGTVGQAWVHEIHVPLLGEVELVTSAFFDVGVYLIVVGLVADVLRSLGAHVDATSERAAAATAREAAARGAEQREGALS